MRADFYTCLTVHNDALLCTDGPVRTLVDLALAPEQRRGHDGLGSVAATCPQRLFCRVYGGAKNQAQMIPGWRYSVMAALELQPDLVDGPVGRGTAGPDDAAEVTAVQVRWVLDRLIQAGNAARAASAAGTIGRPPKHGSGFHLADPTTWPDPQTTTIMATRCGTAVTCARALQHPWLTRRAA